MDFSRAAMGVKPKRTFDDIAAALLAQSESVVRHLAPGGQTRGLEYVTRNPNRSDRTPGSFSVNTRTGVWADFASNESGSDMISLWAAMRGVKQGEAKKQAEEWLGLADAPVAPPPALRQAPAVDPAAVDDDELWWRRVKPDRKWEYRNQDGVVVAIVYRWNGRQPGDKKVVRPWDVARGIYAQPEGDNRPLYRLPEILASSEPVVLVGGEKCAEAVVAVGYCGTTFLGGESAIRKTDWTPLAGRDVVVWPDNDQAGRKFVEKIADLLKEVGVATIRVVRLPDGKPLKWDAADADAIERAELVKQAIDRKPDFLGAQPLDLTKWTAARTLGTPEDIMWMIEGSLPRGVAGIVAAEGGLGKSYLLLGLCFRVAYGSHHVMGKGTMDFGETPIFGGRVVEHGRAVYLAAEDSMNTLHRRIAKIDPTGLRKSDPSRLMLVSMPDAGGIKPLFEQTREGIRTTEAFQLLRAQLRVIEDLKLVSIDPLQAFAMVDINADPKAAQFVGGSFASLASELGCNVVVAHHHSKANRDGVNADNVKGMLRGSSAIIDSVRWVYSMWAAERPLARQMCDALGVEWQKECIVFGQVSKANDQAIKDQQTYLRQPSGLLVDCTDTLKALTQVARGLDPMKLLIESIGRAAEAGFPFQLTSTSSGLFVRRSKLHPELRKLGKAKLAAMGQELIDRNRIVQVENVGGKSSNWLDVPGGELAKGEAKRGGAYEWRDGEPPNLWPELKEDSE